MKHLLPFALLFLLLSCNNADTPLDAETRRVIDSISADQIRNARAQLDSSCKRDRTTVLPLLIDSLRKERLKEIERQLKTVPK